VVGGVEAKGFAYFFVLLGLARIVCNRWNAAWVLLGAASAFHVLVGGWSVLLAGAVWTRSHGRTPLLKMLPGLACGGILAAAGLWPAAALSYGEPAETVAQANQIYVFERLPHHLAILSQEPDRLFERAWRHLSGVVALLALVWVHSRSPIRDAERDERLARIWRFAAAALLLTLTGLAIELVLRDHPGAAAAVLRYYWYRLGDFAVPLGVALFAARAGELALARRPKRAAVVLAVLMLFPGWYLTKVTRQRLADPAPRTERSNRVRHWGDWLDATEWIRRNTPPDALFLTPRGNQTFKWRTGHPEVITQKDIPQSARGIVAWRQRLDDVYGYTNEFGEPDMVKSLGHHGTQRVLEIARKYSVDYVLTDTRRILGLPIVYLNEAYVVYRVPAAEDKRDASF
jgi:hypothetical protein